MTGARLEFRFDWEPAEPVRSPELRATWARLEIWVGPECITQVEDATHSVRRSIYVPLYPLAEWVAYNWWLLKAHLRPASLLSGLPRHSAARGRGADLYGQLEHHNLRAVGEGFPWPDLTILPEGEHTRLVWRADGSAETPWPVRFIRTGEACTAGDDLEQSLSSFVEAVITRLAEEGVAASALEKEWHGVRRSDPDEVEFCLAAARLGLDPYSMAPATQQAIERAAEALGGDLLVDFLDAVNPSSIAPGIAWTVRAMEDVANYSAKEKDRLVDVRERVITEVARPGTKPWRVGWEQARRVRDLFGLTSGRPFDFTGMMPVVRVDSHDPGLQALGGESARASHALVLGNTAARPQAERFTQGRALWHFLFDREQRSFLITAAHTDRQRVERAFAAELLAPAEGIAEYLNLRSSQFALEDIETVADWFGVSPRVVSHQVENQLL